DQYYFLVSSGFHNKGCRGIRPQVAVGMQSGEFYVLRVQVSATDNDQVLAASSNEELAIVNKPKVSSAQEGSLLFREECGPERCFALLQTIPVALGHAGTADPNLPNFIFSTWLASCRINQADLMAA